MDNIYLLGGGSDVMIARLAQCVNPNIIFRTLNLQYLKADVEYCDVTITEPCPQRCVFGFCVCTGPSTVYQNRRSTGNTNVELPPSAYAEHTPAGTYTRYSST